ncbi:MAG TPA: 6-phosphogluconolactonase [Rhizomicrobium sp.]|nr:6-phosphogluconolactonase [Rhizomicrobium sp.]
MKLETVDALADAASRRIASLLAASEGEAVVALAGGSTPRATYARLAAMDLPWQRIVWFLGDERFVPHDDPESNYGMIRKTLGARADLRAVETEPRTPEEAAAHYERALAPYAKRPRLFDLVILGLGTDGHTASLFPGSAVLDETARLARPTENGRITLTYPALNSGRHTMFLVEGTAKREALTRLLAGDRSIPAARIEGDDVAVFADRDAAP